jgi:hypothetical protein
VEQEETHEREDLPVFPCAAASQYNVAGAYYSYTISDADVLAVQRFYKKEMPKSGWDLAGVTDMSGKDIGKAYSIYFTKGQDMTIIQVFATYLT